MSHQIIFNSKTILKQSLSKDKHYKRNKFISDDYLVHVLMNRFCSRQQMIHLFDIVYFTNRQPPTPKIIFMCLQNNIIYHRTTIPPHFLLPCKQTMTPPPPTTPKIHPKECISTTITSLFKPTPNRQTIPTPDCTHMLPPNRCKSSTITHRTSYNPICSCQNSKLHSILLHMHSPTPFS